MLSVDLCFLWLFLKHTYCLYVSAKSCSYSKLISCSCPEAELQKEAIYYWALRHCFILPCSTHMAEAQQSWHILLTNPQVLQPLLEALELCIFLFKYSNRKSLILAVPSCCKPCSHCSPDWKHNPHLPSQIQMQWETAWAQIAFCEADGCHGTAQLQGAPEVTGVIGW